MMDSSASVMVEARRIHGVIVVGNGLGTSGKEPVTRALVHPVRAHWLSSRATSTVIALWALAWIVVPLWFTASPPADNAEQLTWVRSLQWGYYKHPPLPTALLWPCVQLFGLHAWLTYVLAAALNVAALWWAHRLTRELVGAHVAHVATLATLCIGFYTRRLVYFNHDAALMVCVVAAAWFTWRAYSDDSLRAWLWVGVALGLGVLAKHQIVLAAGVVFWHWARCESWKDAVHRRGLMLAVGTALMLASPHIVWVVTHDFMPVRYALQQAETAHLSHAHSSLTTLQWLGKLITQLSGVLIFGTLVWLLARASNAATDAQTPPRRDARSFLLEWGLLPLAAMPCIALATGSRLHLNWAAAYLPLTCAALSQIIAPASWRQVLLARAWTAFGLVQLVAMSLLLISIQRAPAFDSTKQGRFAAAQVANAIGPAARDAIGGPIRVLAGPQRLVSQLSLALPERPLVLIDGRYDISPWLPRDMQTLCAIVWVGGPGDPSPPSRTRHEAGHGLWWSVQPLSDGSRPCS